MDSRFLKNEGFKYFGEFPPKNIKQLLSNLDFSGVYAFVINYRFDRLVGRTDVLYIGQAGYRNGRHISQRMHDYYKAYESAPQDLRINQIITRLTKKRVGWLFNLRPFKNKISVYCIKATNQNCGKMEQELLKKYFEDHSELPPLNRRY